MICRQQISATVATGGAGTATATATSESHIRGLLLEIHLEYLDSPPAGTTDVVVMEANNSPARTFLTVTNAATNNWFPVRDATVDRTGTAITGGSTPIAIDDHIKVTISHANNGDGVTATLVWDDGR